MNGYINGALTMLTWHLAHVFLAYVGSFACDSLSKKYFLQLTGHKCVTPETLGPRGIVGLKKSLGVRLDIRPNVSGIFHLIPSFHGSFLEFCPKIIQFFLKKYQFNTFFKIMSKLVLKTVVGDYVQP